MARQPDLDLAQWWRELISQQPESGMTIAAFCQSHQISTASFYQWRRKLADALPTPKDQFVRVEVLRDQIDEPPVRVLLPSGSMLEIPPRHHKLVLGVLDQLQRAIPPHHDLERRA